MRFSEVHFQTTMLVVYGALTLASCIGSPYPADLLLQHAVTPLFVLVMALTIYERWWSNGSFACIIGFMLLHSLGARYIYSYVPYDEWIAAVTGHSIQQSWNLQRNHYDRIVHLAFGLLLTAPLSERLRKSALVAPAACDPVALAGVIAGSAVYELVEWGVAIGFAPDWADRYLGQQGDAWDAQKDMSLALAGSAIVVAIRGLRSLSRRARATSAGESARPAAELPPRAE